MYILFLHCDVLEEKGLIQHVLFQFDCLSLLPLDLLYLIEMKVNPWCRLPRLFKVSVVYPTLLSRVNLYNIYRLP